MNNVAAYVQNANPIPADQPWDGGFGENSLLRTIGMIILVVIGVFQLIACLFECLDECFGNQVDAPQPVQINLPGAGNNAALPLVHGRGGRVIEVNRAASAEAERVVQGLEIDPKMIGVTPPSVEKLAKLLEQNDVSKVNLEELTTHFDRIFNVNAALEKEIDDFWEKNNREVYNLSYHQRNAQRDAARKEIAPKEKLRAPAHIRQARANIAFYVAFVKNRNGPSSSYCNQLDLVAKNIIVQLGKADVPLHKKQTALMEIADAAEHCKPRILEESKRQFLHLIGGLLSINDKFLLWAQLLKDEIIIQNFQGTQFHVLNRARLMVGKEWGLDCDPTNLADVHIGCGGDATAGQYNAVLNANYRPGRLVEAFYNRLVYDEDLRGLYEFLDKNLNEQEKALVDPDHADGYIKNIKNAIGEDVTIITLKGVAKIAQIVGLLAPKK